MTDEFISYSTAKPEDFDAIELFVLKHFVQNEPIHQALSTTANEFREFLKSLIYDGLKYPISFIALNSKIIGVGLNNLMSVDGSCGVPDAKDSLEKGTDKVPCNLSSMEILEMFLDAIDAGYHTLIPEQCQKLLKIVILCVNIDEYGRRGIATKIVKLSEEKAIEFGCDAVSEATARASQNLFQKENFEILKVIKHENFLDENGGQLIRCKDGTNQGQLVFKRLSDKL